MVMNSSIHSQTWDNLHLWSIDSRHLDTTEQEMHLGIQRMSNGKAGKSVENNIQKARRAAYALMGAGLHSINGLHIRINLQLWKAMLSPDSFMVWRYYP